MAERVPLQFVCPGNSIPYSQGFSGHGHALMLGHEKKYCLEVADFIVEQGKRYAKVRYQCPDGMMAKGRNCYSSSTSPPLSSCPPGTIMRGDTCVRVVPLVVTPGRVTASAPNLFCPPGMLLGVSLFTVLLSILTVLYLTSDSKYCDCSL